MTFFNDFFHANRIKGFLAAEEGLALYEHALTVATTGPCLEIGSYCGKSAVYLGRACQQTENTLYAVDHHRGSEEHQPGEEYHDQDLYDARTRQMDSFPAFRRTLRLARLDDCVVPVVASSELSLRHWATPLGLVFIDGGHSPAMAMADVTGWATKLAVGGLLCIHDIYPTPEDGGQGPRLAMQAVLDSGGFTLVNRVASLAVLQRS
ncbi:class I SAM-dependent methyltransferase [Teredinibacter turnerae]|uniref:class I SAM-dependent methyltransferase n=1 Tax=Teredinibacter turnerae TaxID=2426 RepID=UPI00037371C0|nr:class I SAM-dependent methyltransferase [Teredinibacter turnerae]